MISYVNGPEDGPGVPAGDSGARWTEKDVRAMLRTLKRPHRLSELPMVKALMTTLNAPSAVEAVVTVISDALPDSGPVLSRLRRLVWACDIEVSSTHLAAAADMNLSPRQFFRYRSEAVDAILTHVRQVFADGERVKPIAALAQLLEDVDPQATVALRSIGGEREKHTAEALGTLVKAGHGLEEYTLLIRDESADALSRLVKIAMAGEMHGDRARATAAIALVHEKLASSKAPDAAITLEACMVECVVARHFGHAEKVGQASRRLRAAASHIPHSEAAAQSFEVEAAIVQGELSHAAAMLDQIEQAAWLRRSVTDLGMATLLRAQAWFAEGRSSNARETALAARLALQRRPYEAFQCDLLINRANLLLGIPVTIESPALGRNSWAHAYVSALKARCSLAAGEIKAALDSAHEAEAICRRGQFHGVQVFNAVTIAAIAGQRGEAGNMQALLLNAFESVARLRNHLVARDAFECPGLHARGIGPLVLDGKPIAAAMKILGQEFPDCAFIASEEQRNIFSEFLRIVVSTAIGGEVLDVNAVALARSLQKARASIRAEHRDVVAFLRFAFGALLRFENRPRFDRAFTASFDEVFRIVES